MSYSENFSKGAYFGDHIGNYIGDIKGDTRSLDFGSYGYHLASSNSKDMLVMVLIDGERALGIVLAVPSSIFLTCEPL